VVVVIVAEENGVDTRQIVERHGRPAHSTRADQVHGPARIEYIGSVRMFPAAVCIRKVAWPMKVTQAASSPRDGSVTVGSSIQAGQGWPRSSIIRGTAVKGRGFGPVRLWKR
jgi:hypothetical protein